MSPAGTEWRLLTGCPSVGHAELLLAALRKAGLGGEIRGRHLPAVQATPVEIWVQARNAARANEILRELETLQDEKTVRCRACGAVLPLDGRSR
jgi:hypothetical protein